MDAIGEKVPCWQLPNTFIFYFYEALMTQRTSIHGLHVATPLYNFIEEQVLPAVGVKSKAFWAGFDGIVKDLAPQNLALLAERDRIQLEMDKWHLSLIHI